MRQFEVEVLHIKSPTLKLSISLNQGYITLMDEAIPNPDPAGLPPALPQDHQVILMNLLQGPSIPQFPEIYSNPSHRKLIYPNTEFRSNRELAEPIDINALLPVMPPQDPIQGNNLGLPQQNYNPIQGNYANPNLVMGQPYNPSPIQVNVMPANPHIYNNIPKISEINKKI